MKMLDPMTNPFMVELIDLLLKSPNKPTHIPIRIVIE
jgi:hypothetical protein